MSRLVSRVCFPLTDWLEISHLGHGALGYVAGLFDTKVMRRSRPELLLGHAVSAGATGRVRVRLGWHTIGGSLMWAVRSRLRPNLFL